MSSENCSVVQILKDISEGRLRGKDLSKEHLCEVIQFLRLEKGQQASTIGNLLGYSDRQVRRYFSEIRERNALKYGGEKFWREQIGEFLAKTESGVSFFLRQAHDPSNQKPERIDAMAEAMHVEFMRIKALLLIVPSAQQSKSAIVSSPSEADKHQWPLKTDLGEISYEHDEIIKGLAPMQREILRKETEKMVMAFHRENERRKTLPEPPMDSPVLKPI